MIDGIKILDLAVSTDALLVNPRLLFPLAIDEQTGAVLERPRRADQQGLSFTLVPAKSDERVRCQLQGSLHRFHNQGRHNANAFSLEQLLTTLDELVTHYGIDPFASRLNNVEFGLNIPLPFPVSRVLDNLISYKNRPFTKEPGEGFAYYQCYTQRYILKLYDKGTQYGSSITGLPPNLLRVEIKVLKMEYLARQGIGLYSLTDLLEVSNYPPLGKLLVAAFQEILFDEPSLEADKLSSRQRELYFNGRNPKFWLMPEELTDKDYNRYRKQLQRTEIRFRKLLAQQRQGLDWPGETARLLAQGWQRSSRLTADRELAPNQSIASWSGDKLNADTTCRPFSSPIRASTHQTCPKLTGVKRELPAPICPKLTGFAEGEGDETCNKLTGVGSGVIPMMCPKLTGVEAAGTERETPGLIAETCNKLTGSENEGMSQINRLSIGLIWDIVPSVNPASDERRGTPLDEANWRVELPGESEAFLSSIDGSVLPPSPSVVSEAGSPTERPPDSPAQPAGGSSPRRCLVTGLDITHQRANTRCLTARTLMGLHQSEPLTYQQLAGRYLPPDRASYDIYCQSYAIACRIRQQAVFVQKSLATARSPSG